MDIELNELASFLKETKENENITFSGMFTDIVNQDEIFNKGLSFKENNVGYFELSETFYEDPELALTGSIRPDEILVIIENNEDRRKLHSNYDAEDDKTTPYFDSTKIVGCINSALEFIQNNNASLVVEKPASLKFKNN